MFHLIELTNLNPFYQLLISMVFGSLFMSLVFLYAQHKERYDIVDSAWGMTFLFIASMHFYIGTEQGQSGYSNVHPIGVMRFMVFLLVATWAIRISSHIFKRFLRSDVQDPRYTEITNKWNGNIKIQAYVKIFILQAVLASIIVWPAVLVFNGFKFYTNGLEILGVIVWIKGFLFESLADYQLQEFVKVKSNHGKILSSGLWKYSRHPNYFGEILQWWGIALIALNVHYGYLGLASPILLTYLIVRVSGLPPAERRAAAKPGWKEYKLKTSPLIPWFPSKS